MFANGISSSLFQQHGFTGLEIVVREAACINAAESSQRAILNCSAVPGPELSELLQVLSTREGLALINLEDVIPEYMPEEARKAVLTTSEAKGLDFHSVCVLNAGRYIERALREEARVRADSEVDVLRKRLAIDQLRVALSRPTERLIWLDVNPTDTTIRQSLAFLNGAQLTRSGESSEAASTIISMPWLTWQTFCPIAGKKSSRGCKSISPPRRRHGPRNWNRRF